MKRELEKLRNIGIIAHIDAGKTTVTERMLFLSGAKHRVGEVDKGTTDTDSDPEEQERGITIYAACVTFPWKNVTINLLDTPGHVDFTAEVERCLRVLDGAVVVFSAGKGWKQSETVWRQADKYKVPRVAFINKLDREGADFEAVYGEISKRLAANPVAIQIPVGQGPPHVKDPFRGIIDLIEMKMLTFGGDRQSRDVTGVDIPEELQERAGEWRTAMLEKLYDYSNELMELALQEEPIPADLIRKVLHKATVGLHVQPVLCGSALHGIGVQPVLDAVQEYLPSPLEVPPVEGRAVEESKDGKEKRDGKEKIEKRKPSSDEPFCGLVFKVLPAKTGDIYWIRVYSGVLKQNSRVLNPGKNFKENVSQLWIIHATKREEQIESVQAGDIVGVIGPRQSITGDTLCDPKAPLLLETIQFPETVISAAVEPESTADRKKLGEVLEMLKRQDPTFRAHENEETGQTIISGMGELHLEVVQHRLERDFNLNVRVHRPRVSYKEMVNGRAEAVGKCNRQIGGQTLFAEVKVRVAPLHEDHPAQVFTNWFTEDSAKQSAIQLVLSALKEAAEGGGLKGCPLWSCSLELLEMPVSRSAAE